VPFPPFRAVIKEEKKLNRRWTQMDADGRRWTQMDADEEERWNRECLVVRPVFFSALFLCDVYPRRAPFELSVFSVIRFITMFRGRPRGGSSRSALPSLPSGSFPWQCLTNKFWSFPGFPVSILPAFKKGT